MTRPDASQRNSGGGNGPAGRGDGTATSSGAPAPATSSSSDDPPFRLDHEITRKYDPSALSKLIVRDYGRGEALDLHTRGQMERRLGGDFSNVRLIRGPLAEEVTARYRADAVTVGGTELILVREGWRSNFASAAGQALLAHELTHVQQQQRGLHFAHAHDDDDSSPHEQEALLVEHMTMADQQGAHMAKESSDRQRRAEINIWEEVKKKVRELGDKENEQDELRGGSANMQGPTGTQ